MHSEDEKLATLADKLLGDRTDLPHDDKPLGQAGIRIKGNNGTINFGTQLNIGRQCESRDLVPAQRQALYDLGQKCVELGADSREIWRRVFAELGVKQIGDITANQFTQARDVLQARLDQLQDEDDRRRLIGKILRAATERDAKAELSDFCDLTFGRTHLNSFKRADLQQVLSFIQNFEVRPLVSPLPAQPERLELREFLITYKANAFWLFAFGIIVDRFWIGF